MAHDTRHGAGLYSVDAALPPRRVGLFDARLAFLTALALAPLYAVMDLAQRRIAGPDTAFSQMESLPVVVHAAVFLALYALVWLTWFALLSGTRASQRERHPLLLLSQVGAIHPILRTYCLLVFGIFGLLLLTGHLSLGLDIQTGLLLFTFLYAGQPDRRRPARRSRRQLARAPSARRAPR